MEIAGGIVIVLLSLLAWGGQTLNWFAPNAAGKLNLTEAEDTVEPTYWADIRGEALWDSLTLWTMVPAGILLMVDDAAWAYFGLVGGGIYVYFAGRGILTRLEMQRRGFRIGKAENVKLGLAALAVWGLMGLLAIVAAVISLSGI
ncbi:MAG: hypothetical protein OEM84_12630 [Acidimicrobiia bacterium]|nr:hypothetical protein [Acidimicrobiia bacterium]MDH5615055.1 hypothetical protein [Acidimicrobiia bacterium]